MKKRIFSLLLVFSFAIGLCPMALAAEEGDITDEDPMTSIKATVAELVSKGEARETNFFTDENAGMRTGKTLDEICAEEYTFAQCAEIAQNIHDNLMDDVSNVDTVKAELQKLDRIYAHIYGLCNAGYLQGYRNYYSNTYWDDSDNAYYAYYDSYLYYYAWYLMARINGEVLLSPCAEAVKALQPDEDIQWEYIEYAGYYEADLPYADMYPDTYSAYAEEPTEEEPTETDPDSAYLALCEAYNSALYETYTTDDGLTTAQIDAKLAAGEISSEEASALKREISKNRNKVLGQYYLDILALGDDMSEYWGYPGTNYLAYTYEYVMGYDYDFDEIQVYADAVKKYIAPIYQAVRARLAEEEMNPDVFAKKYGDGVTLDMIEPYVGKISSEMLESFLYMREYSMIDDMDVNDAESMKYFSGAATYDLYGYGTSFVITMVGQDPDDTFYDFSTIVHEFGHYNAAFYRMMQGFYDDAYKSMDVCEVHSQGFELLMTHFYDELFGADADTALLKELYDRLYYIVSEAEYDEFERYAWTTPDVTLQELNEKWMELGKAYGMVSADSSYTERYTWVSNYQLFNTPANSISYSTSMAGAFTFWLEMQGSEENFTAAADKYLQFAALPRTMSFEESFLAIGYADPLAEESVKELGNALTAALGLEESEPADIQATIGDDARTVTITATAESDLSALANCATVVAASYTEEGQMLDVATADGPSISGTETEVTISFDKDLEVGDYLFFLDEQEAPVYSTKLPLQAA